VSAHAHTRSERKQLASSLTLQAVMSELVVRKEMVCINREGLRGVMGLPRPTLGPGSVHGL
jgi:hypothetical protein